MALAAACMMAAGITSAEARPSFAGGDMRWEDSDGDWAGGRRHARSERYGARRSVRSERHRARRTARTEQRHGRRGHAYASESSGYSNFSSYSGGAGARPRQWCGWWMRTQRGGGPELNLAWNWSRWGRPSGPQVGAVVVWRHHVGEIVGRTAGGQWLVRSGNDGGAVRTRARSVAGAVFRVG
jgi:hypothetical protein